MEAKKELQVQSDQTNYHLTFENETTTKFTLFPKLLVELRLMIWKHALPQREYLEVSLFLPVGDDSRSRMKFEPKEHQTDVPRACKESRAVGLKVLPASLPSGSEDVEIRFDPDRAGVYIRNLGQDVNTIPNHGTFWTSNLVSSCGKILWELKCCKDIRKIAFDTFCGFHNPELTDLFYGHRYQREWKPYLQETFEKLEKVTVAVKYSSASSLNNPSIVRRVLERKQYTSNQAIPQFSTVKKLMNYE